jgi:Sulfatase
VTTTPALAAAGDGTSATEARRARIGTGELLTSVAAVAGVGAVGFSQPMLDLYGRNPELFSASKLQRPEAIAFVLLVAFGGPLVWGAVALALRPVPLAFRIWRAIGIGVAAALVALVLMRKASVPAVVSFAAALLVAVGVAAAVELLPPVRSGAAILGLLAPATAILFLASSHESHYLWSSPQPVRAAAVTRTPPVVVMIFDETDLPMLLTPDGRIDAARYPNIARLAADSTWYRNAIGVSNFTPKAVPAVLASTNGSGSRRPVLKDYPANLFTLLDARYRVDAYQPVTDLCPQSACPVRGGLHAAAGRLKAFVHDGAIVYEHLVVPKSLESHLPSIDEAWGGFAAGDTAPLGANANADPLAQFHRLVSGPRQQMQVIDGWAARMRADERPTVHFMHAILPHRPWTSTPDGSTYVQESDQAVVTTAPNDVWVARQRAQRYALQVGALDREIGIVRARLEHEGLWQKALVIMTADHGVNFEPGLQVREPEEGHQLDELYRVPLLVKRPGQRAGAVSDEPVETPDILPTILGVVGASPVKGLDGLDLAKPVPANRARLVWNSKRSFAMSPSVQGLLDRVAWYDRTWFSKPSGWNRILQVGTYGSLVGSAAPSAAPTLADASYRVREPSTLPAGGVHATALVDLDVELPDGTKPADGAVLLAYGGRIVCTLGGARHLGDDRYDVTGIADWRAFARSGLPVEVYLASGPAAAPRLQRIAPRS